MINWDDIKPGDTVNGWTYDLGPFVCPVRQKKADQIIVTMTPREQEDSLLALGESELGDLILSAQDRASIRQIKKEREKEKANEENTTDTSTA